MTHRPGIAVVVSLALSVGCAHAPERREQDRDSKRREEKGTAAGSAQGGGQKEEPKLELPIMDYVYSGLFTGLGIVTGIFSAGPERDLRDPDKHLTRQETDNLYRRAYYLGLVSKGFYSAAGAMGGWAGYKTQEGIRKYIQAKAQASRARVEQEQRLAQQPAPGASPVAQAEDREDAPEAPGSSLTPPADAPFALHHQEGEAFEVPVGITAPRPQAGFWMGPRGEATFMLTVPF